MPERYAPFGQVIRRELDTDPIAGKYANAMLAHLAAHVMTIAQTDREANFVSHDELRDRCVTFQGMNGPFLSIKMQALFSAALFAASKTAKWPRCIP